MAIAINNLAPAAEDRASGAMVINQSLRFRHGGKLARNLQSDFGSFSATGTLSMWIKIINRLSDNTASHIWRADNVGATGGDRALQLERGGAIKVTATGNVSPTASTALLRDVNAWYHLMIIADSSSVELYANGNLIFTNSSGWSAGTNSFSDDMKFENLNESHNTINFYLAELHYLDGTKATVGTDFGFTDPLTNTWRPKKYTGTHGTNGFYLDFRDPDNLGADRSGNNLNFTASNFIADDVMKESPSGVAYGSVPTSGITTNNTAPSNYCTMNKLDAGSDPGLGEAGLKVGITTASLQTSIRGTMSVSSGKWYFEVQKITSGTINIQCGWAAVSLSHNFTTSDTGVYNKAISGTTVMIAADFDRNAIWTGVDGTWDNSATVAEIESGDTSNATHTSVSNYPLAPMFLDQASSFSGEARFNFGQRDFTHTPPSGYKTVCAANLPRLSEPALTPKEYVGIVTYTGNGSSKSISGVGFKPDLVWVKRYDDSAQHTLSDAVRGTDRQIFPNRVQNEQTSSIFITSFDFDGFSVGASDTGTGNVNVSDNDFVAWCWKAGGSAGTFNVDGVDVGSAAAAGLSGKNITPTACSIGTKQGFSIIKYEGNGSSGQTVPHGLTQAPAFIATKSLDQSGSPTVAWGIFHKGGSFTGSMLYWAPGNTAAANDTNVYTTTTQTDEHFTIGDWPGINQNTTDYISYIWHDVDGLQKFGSYEGTGTSEGTFIELGFKPSLIMCKNVDATNGWAIFDTTRDPTNDADQHALFVNTADGETGGYNIDLLSNGFKHRDNSGDHNSAATFIYMAWAEAPTFNLYGAQANAR